MAATVLEPLAVLCHSGGVPVAPRSAALLSPLARHGPTLIPRFNALRCASRPLRVAAGRVNVRRVPAAVVCEAPETAIQRNVSAIVCLAHSLGSSLSSQSMVWIILQWFWKGIAFWLCIVALEVHAFSLARTVRRPNLELGFLCILRMLIAAAAFWSLSD